MVRNARPGSRGKRGQRMTTLTHLQRLEAESIDIMREAVSESENPVMLYSIGKDSSVMLHLAMKAFYPSRLPFPLLHVDTTWKFREMIEFRDAIIKKHGLDLVVHVNPEALAMGINPFTHGSAVHTDTWKTEGLKQALEKYGFDAAFGGARRDEERARAKERIFSFRDDFGGWDPKNQRPELWNIYNGRIRRGESVRVFPISNWTELDVWEYLAVEQLEVPSIYFAHEREVFERDGMLYAMSERVELIDGEQPFSARVRYRTVGDMSCTGAVRSTAADLGTVVAEIAATRITERGETRADDRATEAAMEDRKVAGYF
ncbi:MAG: sulfate adenylyltransferase subunit CysD [Solirubrobacteraceae bacterium]|nr:sulfate adenylyltransferase subunit CysD [Solirubrobacteraceae bacterium]